MVFDGCEIIEATLILYLEPLGFSNQIFLYLLVIKFVLIVFSHSVLIDRHQLQSVVPLVNPIRLVNGLLMSENVHAKVIKMISNF